MTFICGLTKFVMQQIEGIKRCLLKKKSMKCVVPARLKKGCGNGLVLMRDPRAKEGGLYIYGVMGRIINGKRVQRQCWIGTEGKGVGQFTQKLAMEKWLEIKQWSLDNDKNPGEFAKSKQ